MSVAELGGIADRIQYIFHYWHFREEDPSVENKYIRQDNSKYFTRAISYIEARTGKQRHVYICKMYAPGLLPPTDGVPKSLPDQL